MIYKTGKTGFLGCDSYSILRFRFDAVCRLSSNAIHCNERPSWMDCSNCNQDLRFRGLPLRNCHQIAVALHWLHTQKGKSEAVYKDREINSGCYKTRTSLIRRVRHLSDAYLTYPTYTPYLPGPYLPGPYLVHTYYVALLPMFDPL